MIKSNYKDFLIVVFLCSKKVKIVSYLIQKAFLKPVSLILNKKLND